MLDLVWRQFSLDDTHRVRFTASSCQCSYTLLSVVVEVDDAEGVTERSGRSGNETV